MSAKRVVYPAVIVALAGLVFIGTALSQDSRPAAGAWGAGGGAVVVNGGPGGGIVVNGQPVDPEQMKKMQEEFRKQTEKRMQDSLGATDDEWKVLQPKIEKVQTLAMQARGTGGGMFMFGMGGRPDPANQPDVAKKAAALRNVLKNAEAKPEEVNTALKEYREAKAQAKAELEKAQKELKEVLTALQEAKLVSQGLLD